MGFLAKTGLDSIKLGGHKVPIGLIAAGVGLAGVVVVLRARQQGHQVGSVGQAPGSAAETGFGLPLPASDPGAQLANISAQLTGLSQSINGPGNTPAAGSWVTLTNPTTGLFASPDSSTQVTWLQAGSKLLSAGAPVKGSTPYGATSGYWASSAFWQPVTYQGQTYYTWAPFAMASQPGINT